MPLASRRFFLVTCLATFIIVSIINLNFLENDDTSPDFVVSSKNKSEDFVISLTDYGWMSWKSKLYPRRIWEREMQDAILMHPNYDKSAFRQPLQPTLVFLDVSTCGEHNYPIYGPDRIVNLDKENGRHYHNFPFGTSNVDWRKACDVMEKTLHYIRDFHPPESRLVVPHCQCTFGFPVCPSITNTSQLIVAYLARENKEIRQGIDIGLPPPAVKSAASSTLEEDPCRRNRTLNFTFAGGKSHSLRKSLEQLNKYDGFNVTVGKHVPDYASNIHYSHFAASPRGDCLFSYRFAEILSHATIPVVQADDWLRPFSPAVVDWDDVAVFVKEGDTDQIPTLLANISPLRRCQMQRNAKRVWENYISTRKAELEGLVRAYQAQVDL